MFVGTEHEIAIMDDLWQQDDFQMLVLYGRRRVGKTALLDELATIARTRDDDVMAVSVNEMFADATTQK